MKKRKVFQKLFQFFYNKKPSERVQKPTEVQLKMVKSSSDMESANIKSDSGSSQEPLIKSNIHHVTQDTSNSSSFLETDEIRKETGIFVDLCMNSNESVTNETTNDFINNKKN